MKNVTLDSDGNLIVDGEVLPTPIPPGEDAEFLDEWGKSEERYEEQNRHRDALTIHAWLQTQSFDRSEPVKGNCVIGKPMPVGVCPKCGGDLVSNMYCTPGGKDFLVRWECVNSLGDEPTCDYSRVI